ncbi:MAG: polysaccharide biosynthesis/export family protein [Desulfuromonadales bacterium]|nr:polysaccharide biosynthesis/export family protein [Desulfuromonadales bacterium]
MKRSVLFLIVLMGVFLLSACTRYENYAAGTALDINDTAAGVIEAENVSVAAPIDDSPEITEYIIGPGDVISVHVPGMVENTARVSYAGNEAGGFRVNTDGSIFLPHVGRVEVAGLSVTQLQEKLIGIFKEFIKNPILTVEIIEFKSQPVYLLGQFNRPGLFYLDRPTELLHGLALGGGLKSDANMRGARMVRNDRIQPVDIYELLHRNDLSQNIQLHSGDTIYVPGNEDQRVFVFGAVGKSGMVPMVNGRLDLIQALSQASLEQKPYNQTQVRIIRSLSPTRGQLMVVDLSKVMNGLAMPMSLMDGDIIYVPKTTMGGWNEAIQELLPSLQLISGVLQPFVQIQYLKDNTR